jgi:hypothetical protein
MTRARRAIPIDRAQASTETRLPIGPTPEVRSRFGLAAARMADAWLRAGRVRVSANDFRIVRDFLERDGWTVEELPGVCVRLRSGGSLSAEMTREAAALVALRRLAAPGELRRRALRTREVRAARPVATPIPAPVRLGARARSGDAAPGVGLPA